jgi:hypothetical protein
MPQQKKQPKQSDIPIVAFKPAISQSLSSNEHCVILDNTRSGKRLEDSLLGKDVKVSKNNKDRGALRLMIADYSEIEV